MERQRLSLLTITEFAKLWLDDAHNITLTVALVLISVAIQYGG